MRMQYTRDDGQHLVKGESLQKSYVELIPLKTFSTIERIPSSSSCFSTILSSTLFIYAFALISFYTFENLIFNRYIYTHKRDDDIRHEIAYMTLSRVYRIKHGIENGIERYIKDRAKFGRLPFVSFRWEKVIARGSSKVAENGVNAKPLGRGGLYSRGGTKPQWLAEGGGRESLPRFGVLPRFVSKRETATWSFPIKRGLYRFVSVLKIHRYPRFDHRYIPARRVNPRQPASHIIGRARVESFTPGHRIIETSVNNDSAISRCITKQTRSGITPGLSPLFFSFHLVFPSAIV